MNIGQEGDSVLLPQEHKILADIMLDSDDNSTAWVGHGYGI